ncbi:MAG: hypothetical protein ACI867_001957 [Glaciecola sp.]|jgi:hypothetical protein
MTQTSTDSARSRLRAEIDLPTPVAVWILAAHALTLFSPLVLVWVTHRNADALGAVLDAPFALHVSAALFFTGSAFEIAQNTMDRWYYQGPYPAFADLLFNAFIAFGLGALGLAAGVDQEWVIAIVVVAAVVFPVLYLADQVPYPATGVLGIVAVGLLWDRLGNPAILLLLVFTTGLNLYFLALIVRTKAQSLHGAIALTNGIGLLAVPLTLQGWLNEAPMSWLSVLAITLVLTLAAVAAWQPLSRLAPTKRPSAR